MDFTMERISQMLILLKKHWYYECQPLIGWRFSECGYKTDNHTAGGSVTSFRFNLSDGTSYEVIYSEVAVKAGRVITTGMEQDFFTSADIGAFWGSYDYEVTTASEDELPALYE